MYKLLLGEKKMETILIKYHNDKLIKPENIEGKSDWIDLRAAEDVVLKKGEFKIISLGVSMKLPDGYEAHLSPRSSTFKKWGIIQVNSVGVIDNSYSGDDDIWGLPVYATRDTEIHLNDRICQFRIMKKQDVLDFKETDHLSDNSRGGFGSTGVQ
jgi:dUTP pyrophosphatase